MKNKLGLLFLLLLILVSMSLALPSLAQGSVQARFVHVAPGVSSLDIFVNDTLAVGDLPFGGASAYLNVPAGDLHIVANIAGTTITVYEQGEKLVDGSAVTMIATSATVPLQSVSENLDALQFGEGRLSFVYAISNGPAIDIMSQDTGEILGEGIQPGGVVGDYQLSAGVFEFGVVPSGSDISAAMLNLRLPLAAGNSILAIIYGSAGDPKALTTQAATAAADGTGLVRFVHAMQGATPVDLSINGNLIIPSLTYAMPSEHIALPVGTHRIALSIGPAEITSRPLTVDAGQAQTVIIMGSPANLNVSPYSDDLSNVNASSATVSLINAIPGSVVNRLTLSSGATAATDVAYGQSSGAAQIVTGAQALAMDLTVAEDRGTVTVLATNFYGGSYYNLIALPGDAFSSPRLLLAETSITRGANIEAMMMDMEMEMEAVEESEITIPEPVAEPIVSVSAADFDGPTAFVNLNQGANLQLREYPTSEARSLGLAPAGTTLIVLGRRGLTQYFGAEPADEPVDLSAFEADPAEGLERWQDLEPSETWLRITYLTPDGGSINAWVNALYLEVVDDNGDPQRLANLEMIRQNEAGRAINTSVGPPVPPDRVSALVYNLDFGVGLNIRMANDANTEILGQIGSGSIVGFSGLDEADEWAYIAYSMSDDVTISGWVSSEYIQILLDGNSIDLEELREQDAGLVPLVSEERRGSISLTGDAEAPPAPTRDPFLGNVAGTINLNPDANLHLRIRPNASTESLALIPSATKMVVVGVTASGEWYNVAYNDFAGWVSADYVVLSFNNQYVPTDDLVSRLVPFDDQGKELPEASSDDTTEDASA